MTRNDSSIIAFRLGHRAPLDGGLRLVGAHTDSPCLRVKPQPELQRQGFFQLGVEVYGGALLAPWFDRDLSLAGRVTFREGGKVQSLLIDFEQPIAVIPNLAIHLNREANQGWAINAQTELPPILAQFPGEDSADFRAVLTERLAEEHGISADAVLDYELSFYDTQSAAVIGLNQDFIAGARLDNLLSCYAGLQALIEADGDESCVLVCTDHEEVGSCSACGADGPFLEQVLRRVLPEGDAFVRDHPEIAAGLGPTTPTACIPTTPTSTMPTTVRKLNAGPVIKVNSNQRYASNSETAGFFRHLCLAEEVPVQSFVTRSDMGCGSTIGPITASQLGVPHRRHRPADLRHALDPRAGRQPRPGAPGEGAQRLLRERRTGHDLPLPIGEGWGEGMSASGLQPPSPSRAAPAPLPNGRGKPATSLPLPQSGTSTLTRTASWRQYSTSQSMMRPCWSRLTRVMHNAGLPGAALRLKAASAGKAVGRISKATLP